MSTAASSSAPPPLADVDMTLATSTASASPHTLPAILYVQVEGDGGRGPVGDVAPLPNDSIRSVMQRAVEQELIDPIRWREVAEWQLWDSRDTEKAQRLHSGTSSEPLLDLAPFPPKSLLVLTRRPASASLHSPASSLAPLSIADIVADNPLPLKGKEMVRKSWPIQETLRLTNTTVTDAFPSYLPFINRRLQCDQCVECFRQQFDALHTGGAVWVTEDNALKNYKVVVSAGGPGIGKTTWARFAFARTPDEAPSNVDSPFLTSLEYTRQRQAMYRIVYDDVMVGWEPNDAERSIAGRLLHQFLKYRLPEGRRNWQQFASHYHLQQCTDLTLQRVAEVIVPLTLESDIKRRVIVINFDEVADVLNLERRREKRKTEKKADDVDIELKPLFSAVLRQLARSSRMDPGCYFCVVLTSTEALKVLELPRSSGLGYHPIQLPLLSVDHMYAVVQRITQLCVEKVGDLSPLSHSDVASLLLSSEPHPPLRDQPKLRYFTYLLELLAGVPRFLEKALFSMGSERVEGPFRPEVFLSTLERVSNPHYLSHTLLSEVVQSIQAKYSGFKEKLQSLEIFPLLVTCSLFKAPVYRSQSICHDVVIYGEGRVHNGEHSIQHLEDSGVIFLVEADPKYTLTLPPHNSRQHARPLGPPSFGHPSPFLRPWLTEAERGDKHQFAFVIPFIWMHLVVANDTRLKSPLPQVQLLSHLGWSLTPSEKERFSLSVLALRMYFRIECLQEGEEVMFLVSDLFPTQLRSIVHSEFRLPFGRTPESCSWQIIKSSHRVTAADFSSEDWETRCRTKAQSDVNGQPAQQLQSALPLFFQNAGQAHSADSFAFLSPPLLLQDKQSHSSKLAGQLNAQRPPSSWTTVDDIMLEHDKCHPPTPHLFVYITDEPVSLKVPLKPLEEKEMKDVVIIHRGNEEEFFGPFLARSKLYHDQEEDVSRGDPTQSLVEVLENAGHGGFEMQKKARYQPDGGAHNEDEEMDRRRCGEEEEMKEGEMNEEEMAEGRWIVGTRW